MNGFGLERKLGDSRKIHRPVTVEAWFPILLLTLVRLLCAASLGAQTYTYPQLLERLTDLQQLAKLPPPGERTALASSYDRRSRYDAATDKYIDWDSNHDGDGFIRREGDENVLMDVQGPGVIWRIWSARPEGGHVKIYLDGASTPTIDLPFLSYFDGKTAPFNRPNLVYGAFGTTRGYDNYTPISFSKSCKIVSTPALGRFYHFNYTLFPAGSKLPTFSMNLSKTDNAALDRANEILGKSGQAPPAAGKAKRPKNYAREITVGPNSVSAVGDLHGSGAITTLKVKLELPKDSEAQRILLRQLTLRVTWDNQPQPAIWSPLGDFFAYVGGADVFQSYPVGLLEDGTFYSYWYMPYASRALIEVGNDGPAPVQMKWDISYAQLDAPIQQFGRFHAKWHRNAFLPTRPDRAIDWTLLTTQGTGRFVGTHLHGWNPRAGWWGEGDEKFFVDGEKFPSTFGTGSEDYFGYAWGAADRFSRPYHNQILNESNAGHFDDNRWHISDSVPFQTSFEADIEKYFPEDRATLYAAETFWYLKPGGADPYQPVPVAARIGYWERPKIYLEPGAIEAESLGTAIQPAEGVYPPEDMYRLGNEWSGDRQCAWAAQTVGEVLGLKLPEQKAGKYRVIARYTTAPSYGIFQANVNGEYLGPPIDLYTPSIRPRNPTDLGIVTLPAGAPVFKVTVIGKNPASTGYHFGVDYFKLIAVP
jgi:hypothetical protein